MIIDQKVNSKAIFLDRDGVINVEKNYVGSVSDFEFQTEIFQLCRLFQEKGFLIIIITNQAGIAKGLYSLIDFEKLNDWMISRFKEEGISVSETFYCPHHPDALIPELSIECNCRKPKPGMILKASKKYNIELNESILIGDKESDILAGINSGIPRNFMIKSHPNEDYSKKTFATQVFNNLSEMLYFFRLNFII